MPVTFASINKGLTYSRHELAALWGYASFHALARGVVTPRDDNKIVLFVTEEKQSSAEQYADRLVGGALEWEGPTDHFAEDRMLKATSTGDQIHLFHSSSASSRAMAAVPCSARKGAATCGRNSASSRSRSVPHSSTTSASTR
jgi:hypothetical protein